MKWIVLVLVLMVSVAAFAGGYPEVTIGPHAIVISGQLTIDAGGLGVPIPLSPDSTAVKKVWIAALPTNTQDAFIGGENNIAPDSGFVLTGDIVTAIEIDNLQDIYVDADVEGEGVSWIAIQ